MNNPFPPSADAYVVSGLAIPYGGKDLDGEHFDASTDLHLEWFPSEGRPVFFHHGLDGDLGTAVIGRQTALKITADGAWVEVQLDKRSKYVERIRALITKGALGFSSGAMAHLSRALKETGRIVSWPWVELSLTPTPAHPKAVVYAVKSTAEAIAHLGAVGTAIPIQLRELDYVDSTQVDLRAIARQADLATAPARKAKADTIRDVQRNLAAIEAAKQAELQAIAAKADDPEIAAMARAREVERQRQRAEQQRRDKEKSTPWRNFR